MHVDIAVCGLALAHLRDLGPAFAELVRVLRPGGHLIITDVHHETVALGSVPHVRSAAGEPRLIPSFRHRASDYLSAALPLGLQLRRCEEPGRQSTPEQAPMVDDIVTDAWDVWPWSLLAITPAAFAAAWNGTPAVVLWHFHLPQAPGC
ncbi:methyltransferase domain-containing protein [Actinoplanes sp. NPDC049548]|uniref:class I SAM-dependent methyltransferase n=1 Tax=Actinoplanes sp. NPDC049548 TaxID=3155152 RepID=UPI00341CFC2A